MAPVRRSSSKTVPANGTGVLLALTMLAGCVGGHPLLGESPPLRLSTHNEDKAVVAAPASAPPSVEVKYGVMIAPAAAKPEVSAWCDYLREDTLAQTTIMRAPSLRGSVADDGSASLALGLSVTDFVRANTLEQSAEARCRKYLAEQSLQKLVFLAPQALTSAGFRAKSKAVEAQRKEIARLRAKAQTSLEDGLADQETATAIGVLADQILADGSAAKSQADRRLEDSLGAPGSAKLYGAELLRAESDLEDLGSLMRTLDAMDVSLSVGWTDEVTADGIETASDAFTGKISFSLKLGALAPGRYAHEQAAKEAKLKAIGEEGGTLWQVAVLRRAHEKALAGLAEQQRSLEAAIAKAEKLAAMLSDVENPEFEPPLIQAKLQLIKLKADRAGVEGSIAEVRANIAKLDAG
jgi:hypothetical protein